MKTLLDKKRVVQSRRTANSKAPANLVSLLEGYQSFDSDLNKLQVRLHPFQEMIVDSPIVVKQFVEINETAVSKILKKVRSLFFFFFRTIFCG